MAPGRIDSPVESLPTGKAAKPTVYLLDTLHPAAMKRAQELFDAVLPGEDRHVGWREKAEYLVIRGSYLTAEDVQSSPRLKAIGKQGVGKFSTDIWYYSQSTANIRSGIDKIDASACRERDIKIFNTPGVNAQAVAETVLTLSMSVARQVGRITSLQSHGQAVPKETCSGLIISRKTVGIVGMGNIGQKVARIFQGGLGCSIVAYDPLLPEDAWADIPHTRAKTLDQVLEASDVLTLHIPLLPQTRNLISYQQLSQMKRNAIIINTARGGIINETDLERALKEGLIFGAGLDCHEQEPPTQERYGGLWDTGRVVSTPHIGAATAETQMETAIAAVDRLAEYIKSTQ
jgi:phosphoglycerate dehydrogenase-like enzyme